MNNAQVIQVIVTESTIGRGFEDDPYRKLTQYWDFGGTLLFEVDSYVKPKPMSVKEFCDNFVNDNTIGGSTK